jgi:hypothetical protein
MRPLFSRWLVWEKTRNQSICAGKNAKLNRFLDGGPAQEPFHGDMHLCGVDPAVGINGLRNQQQAAILLTGSISRPNWGH